MASRWRINPALPPGAHGVWIFDAPGKPVNLARAGHFPLPNVGGGVTSPTFSRGGRGMSTEFVATTDGWLLGGRDSHMNITDSVTVMLGYEKTDATNRSSTGFAINSAGSRLLAHLPWSDGHVYWDFGASRLTLLSPTVTGYHAWAFTVGPRGMEIWQDETIVASSGTIATRTLGGNEFQLGSGDLARTYWMMLHRYQLPQPTIRAILADPIRQLVLPATPRARIETGPAAATAFPWLYYARMRG